MRCAMEVPLLEPRAFISRLRKAGRDDKREVIIRIPLPMPAKHSAIGRTDLRVQHLAEDGM